MRSAIGRSGSPSKSRSTHPAFGHLQHLAEVIVAVDALERAATRSRERCSYTASMAARRSAIAGTSAIAIVRRRRQVAAVLARSASWHGRVGKSSARERCTWAVADSEGARLVAGSPRRGRRRGARRATRPRRPAGTPAPTRERARARCPVRSRGRASRPSTQPIVRGTCGEPASAERGRQLDVGIEAGVQLPVDLADDRDAGGPVDERRVGLLAGHDARGARLVGRDVRGGVPRRHGARSARLTPAGDERDECASVGRVERTVDERRARLGVCR